MHESVELPVPPVMLVELSPHARFVELVVTVSATVPVKPLRGLTVIVEVPGVPATTVTLVGVDEIVKSGATVTW